MKPNVFSKSGHASVSIWCRNRMLVLSVLVATLISGASSLKCYRCLNLDCPQGDLGEVNERLCQSVRSHIIKSINYFYEVGPAGYIPPCPELDETVQWTLLQHTTNECPEIREMATCSLGRIQIISEFSGRTVVSHATILGCLKSALLYYMQKYGNNVQSCSIFRQNSTVGDTFQHSLKLENCPKVTDYCKTKNYCVPFSESVVRPFQDKNSSSSFESGIVIAIIVVILVVVSIVLFASFCKNPLNRGANYSPTEVQNAASIRDVETPESELPSTSSSTKEKDDVFT